MMCEPGLVAPVEASLLTFFEGHAAPNAMTRNATGLRPRWREGNSKTFSKSYAVGQVRDAEHAGGGSGQFRRQWDKQELCTLVRARKLEENEGRGTRGQPSGCCSCSPSPASLQQCTVNPHRHVSAAQSSSPRSKDCSYPRHCKEWLRARQTLTTLRVSGGSNALKNSLKQSRQLPKKPASRFSVKSSDRHRPLRTADESPSHRLLSFALRTRGPPCVPKQ